MVPVPIGKKSVEPAAGTLAMRSESNEPAFKLDVGHIALHVGDMIDGAAVDIAEWKIIEQVVIGVDVELLGEQVGTCRANALQVLHVHSCQFIHFSGEFQQFSGRRDV
jgi:hypothetical protein